LSGLVLFYTIRTCLGPKIHTEDVRIAWTRLYARMMQIIIPIVVSGQMPGETTNEGDFWKIVKQDTKEGEKAREAKDSRTPPTVLQGPPTLAGTGELDQASLTVDGLDDLGDSLVRGLKVMILACQPPLIRNRNYKGQDYKDVLIGCELVDFLIVNKKSDTRENAVRMASQVISCLTSVARVA
jgi:hypothetical protein